MKKLDLMMMKAPLTSQSRSEILFELLHPAAQKVPVVRKKWTQDFDQLNSIHVSEAALQLQSPIPWIMPNEDAA
jgi:hypothetical protein